jgi:hypothetical protein
MQPFAILNNDYAVIQAALLDGKPVPPESRFGRAQALCRQLSHGRAGKKERILAVSPTESKL